MRHATFAAILTFAAVLESSPFAASQAPPAKQSLNTPFEPAPGMLAYVDGLDALGAFELERAIALFDESERASPELAEVAIARGLARALTDDPAVIELGVADLQRGRATVPRDADVVHLLVLAETRAGRDPKRSGLPRLGTQDRFERLLHSACGTPGQPSTERGATQRRRLRAVAEVFVLRRSQGIEVARTLFARGAARRRSNDLAGACRDLARCVEQYPQDYSIAFHYSAALTGLGDLEKARQIASLSLQHAPGLVAAYTQRAMAAARMGNLARARADMDRARLLDPKDEGGHIAIAAKYVAEDEAAAPKRPARELLDALLAAARGGKDHRALAPAARELVRAANSTRKHGDEYYQENLSRLQWACLAQPSDGAALARLGRFLLDETELSGEWIDPGESWSYYRLQTDTMLADEIARSRAAFEAALALDGGEANALAGMALLAYRNNDFGACESYAQRAMALRPDDPEVLGLLSDVMAIAAGRSFARSLSASATIRTESFGSDRVWIHEISPSMSGYALAGLYSQNAEALLAAAKEYTRAALRALDDTPESWIYLGHHALRNDDYPLAIKAFGTAARARPTDIECLYGLANGYAGANQFDGYLDAVTRARNLEHTSIAAHLLGAWQLIGKGQLADARNSLALAAEIDPGNARIPAFLGAIAEGEGNDTEALACYRAALALEEARLHHRGAPFASPSRTTTISDVALAMTLRLRIAAASLATDPRGAAAVLEENLACEPFVSPADMLQVLPSALLPRAGVPHKGVDGQRRAPRGGEVMRTSCRGAASAHERAGDAARAGELLQRAETYREYLTLAGAARNEKYDTLGWTADLERPSPIGESGRARGGARNDPFPPRRR